jgi:hypothetical protein
MKSGRIARVLAGAGAVSLLALLAGVAPARASTSTWSCGDWVFCTGADGAAASAASTVSPDTDHVGIAAHAHPMNNENAYLLSSDDSSIVGEVAGPCEEGDLCLYSDPDYQGTMFVIYGCDTYSLVDWTGEGSLYNNQTSGTTVTTEYGNHSTDKTFPAGSSDPDWNSAPDDYVASC